MIEPVEHPTPRTDLIEPCTTKSIESHAGPAWKRTSPGTTYQSTKQRVQRSYLAEICLFFGCFFRPRVVSLYTHIGYVGVYMCTYIYIYINNVCYVYIYIYHMICHYH